MNRREFSDKLLGYYTNEFASINLTRITEPDEFYLKQVVDSVEPLKVSPFFAQLINKTQLLLDVGFGGGFPIIPLAFELPTTKFVGIDARNKKCACVEQIAKWLELKNVTVKHLRLEDLIIDLPVVITFKAVGKTADMLKLMNLVKNIPCYVFFYKGSKYFELEQESLPSGWVEIENKSYDLVGQGGRYLLGFEYKNSDKTIKPRPSKELVKLSDIVKNLV